nr:hypothetical protein [Candidatus Njordarchaeum guaymaensis]
MPLVPYVELWQSVAIGFWFVVIAYEFLLFGYFVLLKALRLMAGGERPKGNTLFYLFFGIFFLLLAIGRGFFILWDFYVNADPAYLWAWRIGEAFQWAALTFISLAITTRIFENRFLKLGVPIVPAICAFFFLFLPNEIVVLGSSSAVIFALNFVIAPIYAIVIPAIYLYVAYQSAGVIRNSSLLLAIGFLVYYGGRVLHTVSVEATNVAALILAPGIVIIGLMIMTAGAILTK